MPADRDDYSEYKPVETGEAPGTTKGELAVLGGTDGFRYRKEIDFFIPFTVFSLGSLVVNVEGEYEIEIYDGPGINGVGAHLLFRQKVKLRFQLIGLSVGGQIGFFFWSPLDGGDGIVRTLYAEGFGLDGSGLDGWKATDDETQTEFSEEFDFQFDFDDTGKFTAEGGRITGTAYSPAYAVALPEGAIFKVVKDELQVRLIREGSYAFSFKEGGELATLLDVASQLHFALPERGGATLAHREQRGLPALGVLEYRGFVPSVKHGVIAKTPDNVMWLLGAEATVGRLWYSQNGGHKWRRRALRSASGEESVLVMFGNGYSKFDMKAGPDGVLHCIAQKDGNLYYTRSDRAQDVRLVGRALRSGKYRIELGLGEVADTKIYVVNLDHQFESSDGFMSKAAEKTAA